MFRLKFSPLQYVVHLTALLLFIWLLVSFLLDELSINPFQTLEQRTGKVALILLTLSLTCTPINLVFKWRQVLKVRRALGLYAFSFALGHLLILAGLDYQFNFRFLNQDLATKYYIWVGAGAFIILFFLAITSFKWWMKRMGKNWKRLHRLVYLAGPLVILHYTWAKKGSLANFGGEIAQPVVFGIVVLILLVMRVPGVNRWIIGSRKKLEDLVAKHEKPIRTHPAQSDL
jgi:sulfoxide reductase heme-binding subunit YedZ